MFTRIRTAIGFAVLTALVMTISAFAKGGFSFIAITGPNLKEEIRSTDLTLTEDFFAFADFYRNKTSAPADPGPGYEITRYYVDGKREIAFDRLHYYPALLTAHRNMMGNGTPPSLKSRPYSKARCPPSRWTKSSPRPQLPQRRKPNLAYRFLPYTLPCWQFWG
jgi:hypothetical protein